MSGSQSLVPLLANVPARTKAIVIGVSTGVLFLGMLARYLRRRRRARYDQRKRNLQGKNPISLVNDDRLNARPLSTRKSSPGPLHQTDSAQPLTDNRLATESLTAHQIGLMGMEALETAISYWDDILRHRGNLHADYAKMERIHELLAKAEQLKRDSEELFLSLTPDDEPDDAKPNGSVYELPETVPVAVLDRYLTHSRSDDDSINLQGRGDDLSSVLMGYSGKSERGVDDRPLSLVSIRSPTESYFTAENAEVADLNEFEEFNELEVDYALYQTSLKKLQEEKIPYRSLRTELVHVSTDEEYLAKLHCLRLAFQNVIKDHVVKTFLINMGREVLAAILVRADKDPDDYLEAFDQMLEFVKDANNWKIAEEELSSRGVVCMSFYDIVLDYLVLDAFEDLEHPPQTVTSVLRNRWLSEKFKETALSTAIWSVLKAKRQRLKHTNGFISHFYNITSNIVPTLIWGFFGPNRELHDLCVFFKNQMLEFVQDLFNFRKVRYTTVEDLSTDVWLRMQERSEAIVQKVAVNEKDLQDES